MSPFWATEILPVTPSFVKSLPDKIDLFFSLNF